MNNDKSLISENGYLNSETQITIYEVTLTNLRL